MLIRFHVNHHFVGGLTALGIGADYIKTVVTMATDSFYVLRMGKHLFLKPQGPEPLRMFAANI